MKTEEVQAPPPSNPKTSTQVRFMIFETIVIYFTIFVLFKAIFIILSLLPYQSLHGVRVVFNNKQ